MLHQVTGEAGGARGAVAFSHHEERRRPALIAAEIQTNELAHGLDIAPKTEKFSGLVALHGAAVAGAYGVDEYKIGLVKPGLFVIDELVRRRRHHAIGLHAHAFGADGAEMEPYRSRSRTAVERESQGPALILAVERIGDKEDVRLHLSGVSVLERHHPRGCGVMQSFAADVDFMVGDNWRRFRWFFPGLGCRGARRLGLFGRTGRRRRRGGPFTAVSLGESRERKEE